MSMRMASSFNSTPCYRVLRYRGAYRLISRKVTEPHSASRLSSASLRILGVGNHSSIAQNNYSSSRPFSSRSPKPDQQSEASIDLSTTTQRIAAGVKRVLPSVTETYIAYGSCEKLIKESARPAAYTIPQAKEKDFSIPKTKEGEDLGVGEGWWYETLGLTPTFNTWAQITFLHMYLLTVRIRCFPKEHAPTWHQHLLDHFFYAAEERMVKDHNVHARAIRNKYLKDLFIQWRGLLAGYDEGLVRGDTVLATAVWRNILKADENVDLVGLGQIVSYMRGVLKGLDAMSDEAVASGEVVFSDPATEKPGVIKRSSMLATLNNRIEGEFEKLRPAPA